MTDAGERTRWEIAWAWLPRVARASVPSPYGSMATLRRVEALVAESGAVSAGPSNSRDGDGHGRWLVFGLRPLIRGKL